MPMSNWKQRLAEACAEYSMYRPGPYIERFPDLRTLVLKRPEELTTEDIETLLWKTRHVGDRRLLGRYLPETMDRYVEGRLNAPGSMLYAALLAWAGDWSHNEYDALTEALLTHWHNTVRQHRPQCLSVTTHEVAFLLLWLPDTSPLDAILLDVAQRYYRQEVELVWDETWDSVSWTPFITKLRADPLQTLLAYATSGEMGWHEYRPDPDRVGRLMSSLSRIGVL